MDICTKTDNPMNGKAPVIEFYRYVFMVVLLAFHGETNYFPNGYLVVEFFFILSGYLLMESYLRKPKTAVQYTVDKLKRTYVEYFIALCFCFLIWGILINCYHHTLSIEIVFKFVYEVLLIQDVGIFRGGYNYPMWYFCVLIWGGLLLYYLINRYKDLSIHLLIPVVSLLVLIYLCRQESFDNFTVCCSVFYIPFMRGIAEMGVGILLCTFAHSRYNKIQNSVWLDCLSIVALILNFYLFYTEKNYDKYVFLTFPLIVFVGMRNHNFLNVIFCRSMWMKLGGDNLRNVLDSWRIGIYRCKNNEMVRGQLEFILIYFVCNFYYLGCFYL